MRTNTNSLSLGGIGCSAMYWFGAINPVPGDLAIGAFVLTLTNVVVGSRVYIERAMDDAVIYDEIAAMGDISVPISVYTLGSLYNNINIVLVELGYKIVSIPYTVEAVNAKIPLQMLSDPWFSNPL